jgi:hypothetical protein
MGPKIPISELARKQVVSSMLSQTVITVAIDPFRATCIAIQDWNTSEMSLVA